MTAARYLASAGLGLLVSLGLADCASAPRPADELAALPAKAAKDSTIGRCAESRNTDIGAIGDVVENPEQPAKRITNGIDAVARDTDYSIVAMTLSPDEDPPFSNHGALRATAVAIIDTAGRPVPGSVVVTESEDMALTRGLCDAVPHMKFHPAQQNGRKVRALYSEEFVFYRIRT